MKRIKPALHALLLAACAVASGCVMIQSSMLSSRLGAGSPIATSTSDLGYLHLVVPSDLTQTAGANLLSQCASGKLSGVTTQLSMREFIFVQYYTVTANGFCN